MSAQKLLVCLAIALIAVIATEVSSLPSYDNHASNNSNKSHHLIVGSREPGDRLILRQNITTEKSGWMQVTTLTKTFNTTRTWELITQFRALDQKTNGNGAVVRLIGGGPGFNYVTLKFKSQRGHSINFIVEIYAL